METTMHPLRLRRILTCAVNAAAAVRQAPTRAPRTGMEPNQ